MFTQFLSASLESPLVGPLSDDAVGDWRPAPAPAHAPAEEGTATVADEGAKVVELEGHHAAHAAQAVLGAGAARRRRGGARGRGRGRHGKDAKKKQ